LKKEKKDQQEKNLCEAEQEKERERGLFVEGRRLKRKGKYPRWN
jgi:hypothetical protein